MSELEFATLLDGAAGCLLAVAYGDPLTTSPAVRLQCLWAVELLATAGAVPTDRLPRDRAPAGESIREALAILGHLPAEVFSEDAVLEAAAAARSALDATG